ncbi:MAG: chloride channel protein [Terriglobia bacterium]
MKQEKRAIPFWEVWIRNWSQAQKVGQHEEKIQLVLTLIIGAIVGLVVVAFILLTENLALRMYPAGGAAWRRLLIPILGSLLAGILLQRYFPQARGSGIPQTKAALFIHGGYISLRTTIGKFLCSSLSLASGIALGREGPSVHVGAGIASVLGRKLGLHPSKVKALFPVGAAAALAAAFNTPIAAVLFALEEVMGDMHARVLGSIVLSSATSWIVMRTILGNEPLFHVPAYQLVHPGEILNYALLGVLGGLVSVVFVKLLLYQRQYFMKFPKWCGWFLPAIGGALVGGLGLFVPEVLGVGYGHVSAALNGQLTLGIMLLLVVLKVLATTTCYATGNAGGIFGPSLFIGAMLGGAVGSIAHSFFPDYTGSIGAYALVGMGTAFAGIIRVPLTSVIMIFEITRDYSIIVPLMISNLLSYIISYQLQKEPIYEALQHQEGIHIPSFVRQREGLLTTQQAMQFPIHGLHSNAKTASALDELKTRGVSSWPVTDDVGLLGMISVPQLERALHDGKGEQPLSGLLPLPDPSVPLTAENFPHVHDDHPLDSVMRRMSRTGSKVLPVVSRSNLRELRGIVSLDDILSAYGLSARKSQSFERVPEETQSSWPLLARISVALLLVLTLTGFLVIYYHAERRAGAEKAFQSGNALSDEGRNLEAIEQYRYALSVSHSREHRTALAMALLKAKLPNEAEPYLRELIQEDPDSG